MKNAEKQPGRPTPSRRAIHKFDPLSFAKDLQTTGFTREQAEGLAARMSVEQSAFIDDRLAHEEDIAAVRADIAATRADIDALRVSTKADIEALRLTTKTDLATTKAEILKWMFGTVATQTVILLAAMIGILRAGH
jgi:hypothetical protein